MCFGCQAAGKPGKARQSPGKGAAVVGAAIRAGLRAATSLRAGAPGVMGQIESATAREPRADTANAQEEVDKRPAPPTAGLDGGHATALGSEDGTDDETDDEAAMARRLNLRSVKLPYAVQLQAIQAEDDANRLHFRGGWSICWEKGRGLGLKYEFDVPVDAAERDRPWCSYSYGDAACERVLKKDHEDSDVLLPDDWGMYRDPHRSPYAFLPRRRGAASYANDGTVIVKDGMWTASGEQANAYHKPDPEREGCYRMYLAAGFKAGSFVSVAYGEEWWNAACADGMQRNEQRAFRRANPLWHAGCG